MTDSLTIAIVGHTNTGKTSLIRTLLRNSRFGEVRDQPGTTRHVESARIGVNNTSYIELRDTPGLEDSSALKMHLDQLSEQGYRARDCLQQAIDHVSTTPEFEQEIKVIKQALSCQILFYVIDCREPVFEKYLDEIAVLQLAARPIMPVLNFIHDASAHNSDGAVDSWKQTLAEMGLHAQVSFDTVAYDFAAEKRLYQKLQTLVEPYYDVIDQLIQKRQNDWLALQKTASKRVAHLLYDCCALQLDGNIYSDTQEAVNTLQEHTRKKEQAALTDVLELMQFNDQDIAMSELPVANGHWQVDLFSPETLKLLGLDTASAAATGAAIGAGLDLIFAGMSLGAATATGAALGAAWQTSRRWGRSLLNKLSGAQIIQIDNPTLNALLLRQIWLLHTVFHRGHAANTASELTDTHQHKLPENWEKNRSLLRASAAQLGVSEEEALKQTSNMLLAQLRSH